MKSQALKGAQNFLGEQKFECPGQFQLLLNPLTSAQQL